MNKTFQNYPNTKGIIHVKNAHNEHGFSMWTDNIRARCEHVFNLNFKVQNNVSPHRTEWLINQDRIVFEYVEMPNTDMAIIKSIAEALNKEGRAEQIKLELASE